MKLHFKQSDLADSINIVLKAVPSKTTMPILECILIDASANEIRLTANDMELGIETIAEGIIEEKATVNSFDIWGNRRLAYLINDKDEGYYVLAQISAEPDFPAELERKFKIDENVMRYLVLRKEG